MHTRPSWLVSHMGSLITSTNDVDSRWVIFIFQDSVRKFCLSMMNFDEGK